ncbi:MAG: NAD-binding protein [Bacteroidota bacterium]
MKRIEQFSPYLIVIGIITVFLFGFWGHGLHNPSELEFWQALYAILRMFLLEGETENFKQVIASFIAALILGYGIFQIVWFFAYEWYARFKIRYFYKGHTIIMGNTGIGYRIATELLKERKAVVAIEDKQNFDENIEKIKQLGGLVITTSKSESNDLIKAGIARAGHCLVLTDNDEKNLQTANILTWLNHQKKIIRGPLRVLVNVEDWYKKSFLKDYMDMYTRTTNFDIDTFNTHQAAAQVIYDSFSPLANSTYNNVKTENGVFTEIEASEHSIAIIGFDKTAEHFLIENIILSHSPGLKKLKILLIDEDVDTLLEKVLLKMPFINDFLNIVPIELKDEQFFSNDYFTDELKNEWKKLGAAYFFGEDDTRLIGIANSFRQMLYAEFGDLNGIPIILTLPEKSKALELLNPTQLLGEGENIQLFNLLRDNFNMHVVRLVTDTCTKAKLIDESGVMDALSKVINYFYICYGNSHFNI